MVMKVKKDAQWLRKVAEKADKRAIEAADRAIKSQSKEVELKSRLETMRILLKKTLVEAESCRKEK